MTKEENVTKITKMEAEYHHPPPPPPPPPQPLSSKETQMKRYKPIWRVLLISNLALGAYMFAMARKKNIDTEHSKSARKGAHSNKASTESKALSEESKAPLEDEISMEDFVEPSITIPNPETQSLPPRIVKLRKPIPEDQQRELFKWILEEKRKIQPKDREEKKRIDQEKAMLKQVIRVESIPKF